MIRVLVADDHLAVREGVRAMLAVEPEIAIVGEAADGTTALNLSRQLRPDLVVLDNAMPGLTGRTWRTRSPRSFPTPGSCSASGYRCSH